MLEREPFSSDAEALFQALGAGQVVGYVRIVLEVALMSGLADFEDAVQIACAIAQGLDAIVTRDRNFSNATMPVLSVNQLLKQL
ncbi:PIN domain-containing protein [Chlorogloeopsis sp. ULAP02]|uniref:PIN domain-containing protein n=1 Tax=Chlorogloeopsis sp. ULAP02 TaxID=3107926 RepID=UPI003135E317